MREYALEKIEALKQQVLAGEVVAVVVVTTTADGVVEMSQFLSSDPAFVLAGSLRPDRPAQP